MADDAKTRNDGQNVIEVDVEEDVQKQVNVEDEELEIEVKRLLMISVLRVVEMIERFAQFRIRELYAQGVRVDFDIRRKQGDTWVEVTMRVGIPRDMIEIAKKRFGELQNYIRKRERTARRVDRYKYRFRDFEEEVNNGA